MATLRESLPSDPRLYVDGHDFLDLLAWHWEPIARSGLAIDIVEAGDVDMPIRAVMAVVFQLLLSGILVPASCARLP